MHRWNAFIACTCAACLTAGYASEQFASDPIDVTSPQAHYSGGSINTAAVKHVFVPAPPTAPVDGVRELRELRIDDPEKL